MPATWTEVSGLREWTLWDSGGPTSGITPQYAKLAKIIMDTLEDLHVLQLGTVGSCSIIKLLLLFGADILMSIGNQSFSSYVDVANFDWYDMIIETPFLRKNNVVLNFKENCIIINSATYPAVKIIKKEGNPRLRCHWVMDKKKKEEWLEAAASANGRTMAATVATSQPVRVTHKASIEEVVRWEQH